MNCILVHDNNYYIYDLFLTSLLLQNVPFSHSIKCDQLYTWSLVNFIHLRLAFIRCVLWFEVMSRKSPDFAHSVRSTSSSSSVPGCLHVARAAWQWIVLFVGSFQLCERGRTRQTTLRNATCVQDPPCCNWGQNIICSFSAAFIKPDIWSLVKIQWEVSETFLSKFGHTMHDGRQ